MTNMYTLDHSCITGYLRNYDSIKHDFCLLSYNNTSRPRIVPQEHLIYFDDFLLPCNIPTQIVKPLTNVKHLVSSPLDDKDKSYYTPTMNFFLFLLKPFRLWYKLNIKQNTIHTPHQFETLLTNFHLS